MSPLNTDIFIERSIAKHGYVYDYSLVRYEKANKNVIIICNKHGEFYQSPNHHLRGQGCPKCYSDVRSKKLTKTIEQFILDASLIHNNKYSYLNVNYISSLEKVEITCNYHGSFYQTPRDHLRGNGCVKCANKKSALSRTKSTVDFIIEASKKHLNKYDYSNVKYTGAFNKVEIICRNHGVFYQSPTNHISNFRGCPKCKYINSKSGGWSLTEWKNKAKLSKRFDSFKLYVVRVFNNNEEFIKIGRTYTKLNERFAEISRFYDYEILKIKEGSSGFVYSLEIEMKRNFKDFKYTPLENFGGRHECFNMEIYNKIEI